MAKQRSTAGTSQPLVAPAAVAVAESPLSAASGPGELPPVKARETRTVAQQALGMLETKGMIALVVGLDAMLKAADVRFVKWMKADAGLVLATVDGDVASVRAAIDAGAKAASTVGAVNSAHVIARPFDGMSKVVG